VFPDNIKKNDKAAINEFLEELRFQFGNRVVSVKIYGSKVAGTDSVESDIDILIVFKKIPNRLQINRTLSKIESQLNIKYGVLVSSYPVEKKYFSECSNLPFIQQVIKNGISLWQ
jgi:predicted nucleotidyltransferase